MATQTGFKGSGGASECHVAQLSFKPCDFVLQNDDAGGCAAVVELVLDNLPRAVRIDFGVKCHAQLPMLKENPCRAPICALVRVIAVTYAV